MSTKAPNPVDKYVGSRVRMRRIMLGMSQEKLGEALGLTFQQVQKYEKGTNRVGASRLQQISEILQVPVSFLFEGGPSGVPGPDAGQRAAGALALGCGVGQRLFQPASNLPGNRSTVNLHFADPLVQRD